MPLTLLNFTWTSNSSSNLAYSLQKIVPISCAISPGIVRSFRTGEVVVKERFKFGFELGWMCLPSRYLIIRENVPRDGWVDREWNQWYIWSAETLSCDHTKVTPYYIESITTKVGFWAAPCGNLFSYLIGWCNPKLEEYILMGEDVPHTWVDFIRLTKQISW